MMLRSRIAAFLVLAGTLAAQTPANSQYLGGNSGGGQRRTSWGAVSMPARASSGSTSRPAAGNGANYDSRRRWSAGYTAPQVRYGVANAQQLQMMRSNQRGITIDQTDYQPGFIVNNSDARTGDSNIVKRDHMPHYRYQESRIQVDQQYVPQVQNNSTMSY